MPVTQEPPQKRGRGRPPKQPRVLSSVNAKSITKPSAKSVPESKVESKLESKKDDPPGLDEFMSATSSLPITIGKGKEIIKFDAVQKEMSTGSYGWNGIRNDKITLDDGSQVDVSISINIVVQNSKANPKHKHKSQSESEPESDKKDTKRKRNSRT
ncbi:uncharacterized protein IL334_002183 [Kwoniella shivajii]|uniref:Uncharacterized protein n=1 Tax=Kwoniella shivajii TaxID=564305 RepID=A0ABZ1CVL6_9TREE|nr:hypothetical protein IL334_002183 [Kwoniella shivajii]